MHKFSGKRHKGKPICQTNCRMHSRLIHKISLEILVVFGTHAGCLLFNQSTGRITWR